jgi:hypothetical protein
MQFQNGKYKGRIFVAANHTNGNTQPDFMDYDAHGYYATFKSFNITSFFLLLIIHRNTIECLKKG